MPKTKSESNKIIDLVTGGTSGIGSLLIKRLLDKGHEVRVVLKDHPKMDEEWKNLPGGAKPYVVDLEFQNNKDKKTLLEACEGIDNLIHIAGAVYNVKHSFNDFVNANVIGTENLLNTCIEANYKKEIHIICTGSISVYGHHRKGEVLTEESKLEPNSDYAKSKIMQEDVIKAYVQSNPNLNYTIFRMATLYGERYSRSFFKIFELIEKENAQLPAGGNNILPLLSIEDATDAIILAMENPISKNKIYNLTDGETHTTKELFEFVAKKLDVKMIINKRRLLESIGIRIMNINKSEYEYLFSDRNVSINKAKKELNYKPKVTIEEGGSEMVDLYISKKNKK